jgi:hypothetical protein
LVASLLVLYPSFFSLVILRDPCELPSQGSGGSIGIALAFAKGCLVKPS